MKAVIIIPRENKNAVTIIKELLNAKTALREFIAKGGKAKDFKANT
jgi:hypothetical protein